MELAKLEFELVLPCYNESKTLSQLLERVVIAATDAGYSPSNFQLILVENGSKDNSSEILDNLKRGPFGHWFRKVQIDVNQGYGFGLTMGLATTSGSYIGWAHSDLQCDPKDTFKALSVLKSEINRGHPRTLVKGVRTDRNWKDVAVSRIFELFIRIFLGIKLYETNAQPKIFPRDLLAHIKNPPKNFAFDLYVLYKSLKFNYLIKTIPVLFPPRIHGVSNWASTFLSRYKTILGMIKYMFDLGRKEGRL